MEEINDCPRHARRTSNDGENKKPWEEEDEDVGGPHTGVREPLRVPVQIRRRHRFHVQIGHSDSDLRQPIPRFRVFDPPTFACEFEFYYYFRSWKSIDFTSFFFFVTYY